MATTTKQSMSAWVDQILFSGTTWDALKTKVERESKRRGLKTPYSVKTHISYRTKVLGWKFEESEAGIRGLPPTKPAKPEKKQAAKPAAAKAKGKTLQLTSKAKQGAARKTGKPTGKQVAKTTQNGRQQVVDASVNVPIGAQRDDAVSEPV